MVRELKLTPVLGESVHSLGQLAWAVAPDLALTDLGIQMRTQPSPALQGPASHLLPKGPVLLAVSQSDQETVAQVRVNPG